jgi:hypothetical protein
MIRSISVASSAAIVFAVLVSSVVGAAETPNKLSDTPDWFARGLGALSFLVALATLIWTRLDKWWERKAAEKANLPTGRLYWNPQIDEEIGWYRLKFDFSDVKVPLKITEASASSGTLNTALFGGRAVEGRTIPLQWDFEVNPKHVAYLSFRPAKADQKTLSVELRGRFQTGLMLPAKLKLTAVR